MRIAFNWRLCETYHSRGRPAGRRHAVSARLGGVAQPERRWSGTAQSEPAGVAGL